MEDNLELDERGYFWWSNMDIPEGNFAPAGGAFGRLTISYVGEARLDLDTELPSDKGPFAALAGHGRATNRLIAGILKERTEHLLLGDVWADGPTKFASNGLSYQGYSAGKCLIGSKPFGTRSEFPVFNELRIPLTGYEQWLALRGFRFDRQEDALTLRHLVRADRTYEEAGCRIQMVFDARAESGEFYNDPVTLREIALCVLSTTIPKGLVELDDTFRMFEELMLLLTDVERSLEFPYVGGGDEGTYRFYFRRVKKTTRKVRFGDCWFTYPVVENSFGEIVGAYINRRNAVGSGFYMYLGNRRGMELYTEQKFTSLVVGLEALHRSLFPVTEDLERKRRVQSILSQIADQNDKNWVRECLNRASGPSFRDRIWEILKTGPAVLDDEKLKKLVQMCVKLRHAMAHTGAASGVDEYSTSIRTVSDLSEVISVLYHARILQEIGIPKDCIRNAIMKSPVSMRLNFFLVRCGLLDPESNMNHG